MKRIASMIDEPKNENASFRACLNKFKTKSVNKIAEAIGRSPVSSNVKIPPPRSRSLSP